MKVRHKGHKERREMSESSKKLIPVVETMPADLLTPLSVYLKLSAGSNYSFLLESVEGGKSLARYSFIGADPEFVVSGDENMIRIEGNHKSGVEHSSLFSYLKQHFAAQSAEGS